MEIRKELFCCKALLQQKVCFRLPAGFGFLRYSGLEFGGQYVSKRIR